MSVLLSSLVCYCLVSLFSIFKNFISKELIEESHVSADKDEELSLICRSESPLTCRSDSPSDCVVLPSNITCNNQELVSGDDKPSGIQY